MTLAILAIPFAVALMALLRPSTLALLLGILLPIDVLGPINPASLDLARYALAGMLLLKTLGSTSISAKKVNFTNVTAGSLLLVYLLWAAKALVTGQESGSAAVPFVGIASTLTALLLAKKTSVRSFLLLGFVIGALASSLDIVLQVAGLPFLGSETDWGTRYAGLSFSSTSTAPFLALAVILVLIPRLGACEIRMPQLPVLLRLPASILLFAGLYFSGGRGGMLGLGVAAAVFILWCARKKPATFLLTLLAVPVLIFAIIDQIANFINRGGLSENLTSGRDERNELATEAFLDNLLLGLPLSEAATQSPHSPILLFGIYVGVIGALAAVAATALLAYIPAIAVFGKNLGIRAPMLAIVMVVTAFLEPVGFYVGLAKLTLLFILLTSVDEVLFMSEMEGSSEGKRGTANRAIALSNKRLDIKEIK